MRRLIRRLLGRWRPAAERLPRHLNGKEHYGLGIAITLDGRLVESVTEVLEGEWLVALARDPETGHACRGSDALLEVKMYGNVQVITQDDALDMPPYIVTPDGDLRQPPLISK